MPKLTQQQIRAFDLVHVRGFTQTKAAETMGVTQSTVSEHLSKLRKAHPHFFPGKNIGKIKFVSYAPVMDYRIKHKY